MLENYDEEERRNKGTSIQAGGDVIGVNVTGNKNIIGKNMNFSQTNVGVKEITIDQQILSQLDDNYVKTFKQVTESLTNQMRIKR
jgi:hypothetical protein